jgi:hypothetical protein
MTICQPRSASARRADEIEVETFVDDAEEAQARRGDAALERVGARHRRAVAGRAPRRVVLGIDRARQAEHVRIGIALGLVQARPAGDDEVGALQQRRSRAGASGAARS